MRKWCGLFLSAAIALSIAAPSFAVQKAFNSTFTVQLGSFPGFTSTASGNLEATISALNEVSLFTIPADIYSIAKVSTLKTPIKVAGIATLTKVAFNAKNLKGSFQGAVGKGVMKIDGQASLFIKPLGKATIPLDKGLGDLMNDTATLFSLITVDIAAKPWTRGKAVLQSVPLGSPKGSPPVNKTLTGDLSVVGDDQIFTFIAPTQITIAGDPPSLVPSFGILRVEIIDAPEAGNVLLLATGALVLLIAGYRRSAA
jgi:hypothetical protein